MAFQRGSFRARGPVRVKVDVFAVGRRVFVASPGDLATRVMLMDESGKKPLASLGDGTEVAILGWRPGWAEATRYRVRTTESNVEGWLPVGNLRRTAVAPPPPPPAALASPLFAAAEKLEQPGHRFGQRR